VPKIVKVFRDHLPDPYWHHVVRQAIRAADGYVYFGQYGRSRWVGTVPGGPPAEVAWLPTTIPAGTVPAVRPALAAALDAPRGWPVISLYGYAAPWKDAMLVRAALARMRVPERIVLAGDFWDDPAQAGIDLSGLTRPVRVGGGEFVVVPGYLGPADRAALVRASAAGVFPTDRIRVSRAAGRSPTTSPTRCPWWPPMWRTWPNSSPTPATSCPRRSGGVGHRPGCHRRGRHRRGRGHACRGCPRRSVHRRCSCGAVPSALPAGPRQRRAENGMSPTRLILVRHGQAHCNVARVIGGRRGCTGLTEHGRHQARLLGDRLRADHTEQPLTAAYTTPVPRTRETADIITRRARPTDPHRERPARTRLRPSAPLVIRTPTSIDYGFG